MIKGKQELLKLYSGYGNLLAYLRNLPEMDRLYGEKKKGGYCFENGSRGRGNGQVATSPLGGSNIWLADEYQCVVIYQTEKGRGPLAILVYTAENATSTYLSDQVWKILRDYGLPRVEPD